MSNKTRLALLLGALMVVLVSIASIGRRGTESPADDAATNVPALPASEEIPSVNQNDSLTEQLAPVVDDAVIGGTYAQTAAGARLAALHLLEGSEELVQMTPAEAASAQFEVSTASSAAGLAAEAEAKMVELVDATPGGVRLWVAPIVARTSEAGNGFSVAIWYIEIVAVGSDIVADNYKTVTYSLVWESDTWKMSGSVSTNGPTPTRGGTDAPTSPVRLISIAELFSDEGLLP